MNEEDTKDECLAQLVYHQMLAKSIWPHLDLELSPLDFSLRGAVIGRAVVGGGARSAVAPDKGRSLIKLNLAMLKDHPQEITPTVVHELAHVINRRLADFQGGWRPSVHGDQWRMIMHRLGHRAEVTHKLDVAAYSVKRKTHKFRYDCPCGKKYVVGPGRHQNCQKGWRRYRCSCGYNLRGMNFTDLGRT